MAKEKFITPAKLKVLSDHHGNNLRLPFKTRAAIIGRIALEEFLSDARQFHKEFDAIKIHFVRYEMDESKDHIKKANKKSRLSQVSLVLTPVKVKDPIEEWIADELEDNDKRILALRVCAPDDDTTASETGVCPPKMGCETTI